jgi:hypothetical protein
MPAALDLSPLTMSLLIACALTLAYALITYDRD